MKILTLKGSQWARGGKNGESSLLNDQGCSCCLGVHLLKVQPTAALWCRRVSSPIHILEEGHEECAPVEYLNMWVDKDDYANNGDAMHCIKINDALEGDDEARAPWVEGVQTPIRDDFHRIDLLRPYFRTRGIILRFRPDL